MTGAALVQRETPRDGTVATVRAMLPGSEKKEAQLC